MAIAAEAERAVEATTRARGNGPASPAGAAWTALAETRAASPLAPTVTLRLEKKFAQALDGAADAFLSRVFARAQRLADFPQGFVLEVAEQNRRAVGVLKRVHGFIEQRLDVRPVGGGVIHVTHLEGDLFAGLPPGLAADDINGRMACDLVKPGAQDGVRGQFGGVASEVGEDRLADFLGQLR